MEIDKLVDLNNLRTAPQLNNSQEKKLLEELEANIFNADWLTIGIRHLVIIKLLKHCKQFLRNIPQLNLGI